MPSGTRSTASVAPTCRFLFSQSLLCPQGLGSTVFWEQSVHLKNLQASRAQGLWDATPMCASLSRPGTSQPGVPLHLLSPAKPSCLIGTRSKLFVTPSPCSSPGGWAEEGQAQGGEPRSSQTSMWLPCLPPLCERTAPATAPAPSAVGMVKG